MKMRFCLLCLFLLSIGLSPDVALCESASFDDFMATREVVTTVYFAYGSSDLSSKARSGLDKNMKKLNDLSDVGKVVRVEGFSSLEGLNMNNMRLSLHRAESVAEYLSAKGLKAEIRTTGYGNLKASEHDSAKERRVEIAVYDEIYDLKSLTSQ
jgi:outer membrane protein OmpA-like peptidoglycan-associated protein